MDWISLLLAGGPLLLFLSWFSHRPKVAGIPSEGERFSVELEMASDRELVLGGFRRELSNYLIRDDPDRFLELYRKARAIERAIESDSEEVRQARLTVLTNKYPLYLDFDPIGTRDHVLYSDAFSSFSKESLEDRYLDLVQFQSLKLKLDPNWRFRSSPTSENDLEHLEAYVGQIKNARFKDRLKREAATAKKALQSPSTNHFHQNEPLLVFETDTTEIWRVPDLMEYKIGFRFRDTNEYGLVSVYYGESLEDEPYTSYYRSDATFEAEVYVDGNVVL